MIQGWIQPIASAALAVAFVFALHFLFIAPYRALRMLWPFSIKVIAGHIETLYPPSQCEPQKAALIITNRAYLPRSNCVMHIMSVSGIDDISFPRFITEFSVQPGEPKQLVFLTWVPGQPLFLSGSVGAGWEGNIAMLPMIQKGAFYNIGLRIGVSDGESNYIHCKIWIEGNSLKAINI